jgi:hypothetical protein
MDHAIPADRKRLSLMLVLNIFVSSPPCKGEYELEPVYNKREKEQQR